MNLDFFKFFPDKMYLIYIFEITLSLKLIGHREIIPINRELESMRITVSLNSLHAFAKLATPTRVSRLILGLM